MNAAQVVKPKRVYASKRERRLAERQSLAECMREAGREQQERHAALNATTLKHNPRGLTGNWHFQTAREQARARMESKR